MDSEEPHSKKCLKSYLLFRGGIFCLWMTGSLFVWSNDFLFSNVHISHCSPSKKNTGSCVTSSTRLVSQRGAGWWLHAGSVIACEKVSHQQQQLRAFSLPALGQFNRETSTLPHFSDGRIGGKPIVDQMKENSSVPSNMKDGSGHTCEIYYQFFFLVVLGKVEFGHNWGKLAKRTVMGEHLGMASGEAKQKPSPRCANIREGCKQPSFPVTSHPMPVGISLDGAWSSMVCGRCPCPLQAFGMR